MNADTEARIRTLKNSLECFVCGLLGLLPLVGFPFAVAALMISGKVRVRQKNSWNAARPYWIWGIVFSSLGILLWGAVWIIILFHALNPDSSND